MENLLRVLILASEKAAQIARAWIAQKDLFNLLVEEKTGEAKNQRFVADFKTLADVLVQEVITHDVSKMFPELIGNIHGEETSIFTSRQGESISVHIQRSSAETAKLLSQVLDGNTGAAQLLAGIIHSDIALPEDELPQVLGCGFNGRGFGIWIDPIDGTAEYMSRSVGVYDNGLLSRGLPCVTILIGVFNCMTGEPVAGVINQPFVTYNTQTDTWYGRKTWGSSLDGSNLASCGCTLPDTNNNKNSKMAVAVSSSENEEIITKLQDHGMNCYPMSTVGFKLLKVIDGTLNAYVLSKDSSFKWDTCGAHAILWAQGGGVVPFEHAVRVLKDLDSTCDSSIIEELRKLNITYHKPDKENFEFGKKWSNTGGLIAFRKYEDLVKIIKAISS